MICNLRTCKSFQTTARSLLGNYRHAGRQQTFKSNVSFHHRRSDTELPANLKLSLEAEQHPSPLQGKTPIYKFNLSSWYFMTCSRASSISKNHLLSIKLRINPHQPPGPRARHPPRHRRAASRPGTVPPKPLQRRERLKRSLLSEGSERNVTIRWG